MMLLRAHQVLYVFYELQFSSQSKGCSHDTGLDKQKFQGKILNIFLPIILSLCFGCSKVPSH